MKNELNVFTSELFGSIRAVEIKGKPYFIATDIAKILGYKNTRDAILKHCKGVVKHDILTNGGIQSLNIIPEGDIYRLIIRSKLPGAEKFEEWVFDEVLPSIRQNGGYIVTREDDTDEELLARGLLIAQRTIEKRNQRILQLENVIEEQKPLVTFADKVIKTKENILVQNVAKIISDAGYTIGRNNLFAKLREWGFIFKYGTEPTQKGMDAGYFVVEERVVELPSGSRLAFTTKVTPKGQTYIINRLIKENSK